MSNPTKTVGINKMSLRIKNVGKFREYSIDIILILSAVISFSPYISLIAVVIFCLNFLFVKRHVVVSLIFFSIAVLTSILYYSYLKPETEKIEKEIFYVGFHYNWKNKAIQSLNYYNHKIIEYRCNNGYLPNKLDDIQDGGTMSFEDESFVTHFEKHKTMDFAKFYYEKIDSNHYHLLGIGRDGLSITEDDLLPEIRISDTSKTELIRFKIKENTKSTLK